VTVTHDRLGRLALAFLDGAPRSGLPRGAALEAFLRLRHLGDDDLRNLRAILAVVAASGRRAA
jgi:hypothetical protein